MLILNPIMSYENYDIFNFRLARTLEPPYV